MEAKPEKTATRPREVHIGLMEGRAGDVARTQTVVEPGRLEVASGQQVRFTNGTGRRQVLIVPGPWFEPGVEGLTTEDATGLQVAPLPDGGTLVLRVRAADAWDGDARCAPRGRAYAYHVHCPETGGYAIGESPPTMIVDPPPPPRGP